ncbi:MAG: uroporphyrinogen decarboxylase family protein [Acidobacteriota bacterium]|nr:uroporphyrinogen decarboxylase family protein [Acidobacteriota bacterium]
MTSRERVAAAMGRRIPDRVPVMCQLSIGHMILATGVSPLELWHDAATYVEVLFALRERYQFDGILVSVPGSDPDWRRKLSDTRETPQGIMATYSEPLVNHSPYPVGLQTLYPYDDLPHPLDPPPLSAAGEVGPEAFERLETVPSWMLTPLEQVISRNGGRYSVHGETFSPFDTLVNVCGIEGAMIGLIDEPRWCHEVLAVGLDYAANWGIAQARTGIDALKISSPYVGGGLLSLRHYREFVQPYERQLVERIRAVSDTPVYTHTCGAIGDRLELIRDSGVDGIECLDPPPLGNVDLADAKARVGDALFIKGNMDSVHALLPGDPHTIRAAVHACMRDGAPGGGFILSTACSVSPRVPPEALALVAIAAREHEAAGSV